MGWRISIRYKMKTTRWGLILFWAGLLGVGFFYWHFSGFNKIVKEKFEGRLWELPARVYAQIGRAHV